MSRSRRVCTEAGCPVLTDGGRCDDHRRQADRARGTRHQRGYDHSHDTARASALREATSATPCARCAEPLGPAYLNAHYDHTDDRTGYLGLSHPHCNSAAGGRNAHRQERSP